MASSVLKTPPGCKCASIISESFSYHAPLAIEQAQIEFTEQRITPSNSIQSEPFELIIQPVDDTFVCAHNAYVTVRLKVVNPDGSALGANDKVALVNYPLGAMFKTIETKWNNTTLNPASSYNIPHKAMMDILLHYEGDTNMSLTAGGFRTVEPGTEDDTTGDDFDVRCAETKESKEFELAGPLHADIFNMNVCIAPGNRVALKVTRTNDDFLLQYPDNADGKKFKIQVIDFALYVRRIRLAPTIMHQVMGNPRKSLQYVTTCTEMKEFPLSSRLRQWKAKVYQGDNLPKIVTIAQVLTKSMIGDHKTSPYNFKHFDIAEMTVRRNGQPYPVDSLTINFARDQYNRALHHMFMNCGKYRTNTSNCISKKAFKNGRFIVPFDMSNDQCMNTHRHQPVTGTLDVELKWHEPLPEGVTVLVLFSSEQVILAGGERLQPEVAML